MRMPDGGFRPAYNLQLAAETTHGLVVGVAVSCSGADQDNLQPMVEQVTARYGRQPAAWLADWSPPFINALRDIYRGFYRGDDALFRSGLAALSLTQSEDLFRRYFSGDRVTFRTADFISTFHQIFQRCKQARVALHPDFLPLGIYLAALYDHLEDLAVAVDVAAAFERATRTAPNSTEALHA